MGVEFHACEYDTIEWKHITTIVPEEAAVFEQHLQAAGMDMDEFCSSVTYEDWDADAGDVIDLLIDSWNKLNEAFASATTVDGAGLTLTADYHDAGDEDPVAFFSLQGVRQLTSAGAKYKDRIEERTFIWVG